VYADPEQQVGATLDETQVTTQAANAPMQHAPAQHTSGRFYISGCPAGGMTGLVPSLTHVVIIPSFNSGPLLPRSVAAARAFWAPVLVVIDGSTDGSADVIEATARTDPHLHVLRLPINSGKGAAVRAGLIAAQAAGFTHALVMDADGQHPADRIPVFMTTSMDVPGALVMGRPVFGDDAPWVRIAWRRLSNACAVLETFSRVGDTLFGFRVYPVAALLSAMQASSGMRGFDFDPEAVVRLAWQGVPLIHIPTRVRYLTRAEGGISHFSYVRDNVLLVRMHVRLGLTALFRIPHLAWAWGRRWMKSP
jgi:glycosyltransferase involved in cell wall biosynthesis